MASNAPSCGALTKLDTATNTCVPDSSACQGMGLMYDSMSFSCKPAVANYGTQVWSSNFTQVGLLLRTHDTSAMTYPPIGDFTGITATFPDSEPLFNPLGTALGKFTVPVYWTATGTTNTFDSHFDHQLTFGEVKNCNGSAAVYKDPPGGKKVYKVVVDLAGCAPGLLIDTWGVYSDDKDCTSSSNCPAFDNRQFSAPLGGLPNSFETDSSGKAHFERDVDPAKYFASNVALNGNGHGAQATHVPDLTAKPNASVYLSLLWHLYGQTNGNPGWCSVDSNMNCTATPSPAVALPGNIPVDAVITHQTVYGTAKPIPLSMVQPY